MNLGKWIGLFVLLAACYILWQLRQALLLVFTAIVLATALNQLARWIRNRLSINRPLALFLSISLLVLISIGFFFLIVPPFIDQFQQLTTRVPVGIEKINLWFDELDAWVSGNWGQKLPELNVNFNDILKQVQPLVNKLVGGAGVFLGTTVGGVLSFLGVLILMLMLLADPPAYRRAFVRLFPSFYRRRVDGILDQCEIALGRWVIGALISMAAVALLSLIGLSILQVPLALANAVLAGFLNLIPNLGPVLSLIPPMAIALLDAPWKAGFVLILYFLIQQAESTLLTPVVMAHQVSLLPAVTLLAQGFFITFFGPLGLLLALPLTVVCQVWIKEVLVKDILDQWDVGPWRHPRSLVVAEPSDLVSIMSEETDAAPPEVPH